jgi:hypothetical protein
MNQRLLLPSIIFLLLLQSCVGRQAFYMSPFNGLTGTYHTVPMLRDSVRSATYASAVFSSGSANDNGSDRVLAFRAGLSRSHSFGRFGAWYGASFIAGNYEVSTFDSFFNNNTVRYKIINQLAGRKAFTGGSLDGGLHFIVPGKKGEWRVLGVEGSYAREYGDYLHFRQVLPDSAATIISRDPNFGTLGGYTEYVGRSGDFQIGMKVAFGTVLGRIYHPSSVADTYILDDEISFNYTNLTFHLSSGKWTGFLQGNFAGKATHFVAGTNFRLGK